MDNYSREVFLRHHVIWRWDYMGLQIRCWADHGTLGNVKSKKPGKTQSQQKEEGNGAS